MTDSDTTLNRRSVLRKTSAGLAAATGLTLASGSAAAEHFGRGQDVEFSPCSSCDDCIRMMVDPPNGDWSRDGPYVCRGDEGRVTDTMPGGNDDQFVEVDFGSGDVGWVHGGALEHDFIPPGIGNY